MQIELTAVRQRLAMTGLNLREELIRVLLAYRLGLRVHREAGGDPGEASDL